MKIEKLISSYTNQESKKKSVKITHSEFENIPNKNKKFIQKLVNKIFRSDFDIFRYLFDEKIVIFLRILEQELEAISCIDEELKLLISESNQEILNSISYEVLTQADQDWLIKIGFTAKDILKLAEEYNLITVHKEVSENLDRYRMILGEYKNIVKILKFKQGLQKLIRIKEFHSTYYSSEVDFNGYHLSQIVRNAGWEEKLEYFENPENLERLTKAGFNGYHLSQIVVNAGWEEKLKYFEAEENLERLTNAGFEASHLSQIVRNAGWEEKLKYFEAEENLERLTKAGFTFNKIAKTAQTKKWKTAFDSVK